MEIDYGKLMDKVKFWKDTIEAAKDFTGTSPPSVFVGKYGYPKVYVGVLAPPMRQESEQAAVLDSPERWYANRATISQILNYRGQMIYSRAAMPVKSASSASNAPGKLVDAMQEIAMVRKPVDIEVQLRKQPTFNMRFDTWSTPVGNPAPIESVRLTENPSIERKVDYLVSDIDLKAQDAVGRLYEYGLPISRIQKMFSAGLLGVRFQRKFVPTRWGITAVDDMLGKRIVERVKQHQQLGEFKLFSNEYLGNHYEVLLIPGPYEYELVESWDVTDPRPKIGSDYEGFHMRKEYASGTAGAFYSGRLAVAEYLDSIKRQSAALIVREVRPEYYAPMGIWQLRETVRGAFRQPFERFDTLEAAVDMLSRRMIVGRRWVAKSEMLRNRREQTRLRAFIRMT
ncbi:MAG: hypothetical protein ABIA12_01655 [Candidatus Aenigmatarchaeota archaeon]